MKILYIMTIIFFMIKSWNYGIYEIKQNKNKSAGIAILFLSIIRFCFSLFSFNY